MERYPRLAALAKAGAVIAVVFAIVNAFLGKYPSHSGEKILIIQILMWNTSEMWTETGWSHQETAALIFAVIALIFSKWGSGEPDIPEFNTTSTEDQIEAFEALPTAIAHVSGLAQVNPQTQAIVSQIASQTTVPSDEQVAGALSSMDKIEVPEQERTFTTQGAEHVPLPNLDIPEPPSSLPEMPDLPDMDDLFEEELPPLDLPELPELPDF